MRLNFQHKRNWLKMTLKKIIKSEEDSVLTSEFLCQGENKNEKYNSQKFLKEIL